MAQNKNTYPVSQLSGDLLTAHSNLFTVAKGHITDVKAGMKNPAAIVALNGLTKRDDLMGIVDVLFALGKVSNEQHAQFSTAYPRNADKSAAIVAAWVMEDWTKFADMSSAGLDGLNRADIADVNTLLYAGGASDIDAALNSLFGEFEVGDYAMLDKAIRRDAADVLKMVLPSDRTYAWRVIHERCQDAKLFDADWRVALATAQTWDQIAQTTKKPVTLSHNGKDYQYDWYETAVRGMNGDNGRFNRHYALLFTLSNGNLMSVNLMGPAQSTISRVA